jgi:hypothetical protein
MNGSLLPWVEHKQLLVGRRRAKEGVQVYQNLGGERGSAGSMVDKAASVI